MELVMYAYVEIHLTSLSVHMDRLSSNDYSIAALLTGMKVTSRSVDAFVL